LQSSCVVDPDRCDPAKQRGVYPPKLRGKGEYAGDLRKVPCTVEEEHIGADQLFPIPRHELYYTPTVKHHCPRVALASSLRACSNKVGFDPDMFRRYAAWFRRVYIPRFVKCLDQELVNVNMDTWLDKYNVNYRKQMGAAISRDKVSTKGNLDCNYEAFTKVELQFTTVPHDLKDTPLNDAKERQICGPTNEKKVWANAFINALEGVASRHFSPYCGRANWIEICSSLDEMEQKFNKPIWGASDGSGFDMTQFPEMNKLMNELIMMSAKHPNVTFDEPLSLDRLREALEGSIKLKVGIDRGNLKYEAVGRASGDGWTTFGNTMLMVSYWAFTFEEVAGIKKYGLKVKGDDVLFCLELKDQPVLLQAKDLVFTSSKTEHKHGLGQICKKIDFGDITQLDFLSNEFFRTKEGKLRMTRIGARILQTLAWTTKLPRNIPDEVREDIRKQLLYSKGQCLKAWCQGLELWEALADKMMELGRPGKHSEFNQYADADRVWHNRDDNAAYLVFLEEMYKITSRDVQAAIAAIKAVTTTTGFLELPTLSRFYSRGG